MSILNNKATKLILNTKAFTMIEVIITTGLTIVVLGGLGTLFFEISSIQAQVKIQSNMENVAAQLRAALSDSKAWNNTVNVSTVGSYNSGFLCAARKTGGCTPKPVSATPLTSYPGFDTIQDSSTTPANGNSLYTDNGSNGFTYQGTACTGFSAATATPQCPFSYRLRYQYACPSATSCLNPQVTVFGFLQHTPDGSANLNLDKFQIKVVKGMNTPRNDIVQVLEATTNNTGPISNAPTYLCGPGQITRSFNKLQMDSACNGVIGSSTCNVLSPPGPPYGPPADSVTLVGGTYICYATAQGFGVDRFTIAVYQDASATPIVGAVSQAAFAAALGGGVETATVPNFTVSSPNTSFTLKIVQTCESPGVGAFALGMPLAFSGTYTSNVYSGLYCTRIL